MSEESPLDRFKNVLTGAARAVAHEPEVELTWTADAPIAAGKNFRVPMPGRNLPRAQAMESRGFADSFALKLRHHDEALHSRYAPGEPAARACYDAVEAVRYEALGSRAYAGMRENLDAALMVLRSLVGSGRRPVLAMEMFGWEGQPALDHYLASKENARSEFLERVGWQQNWGGAFEDYEPLVQFAKTQHLPLLAMNPPKTLIRQVVKQGLTQAKEQPAWRQWGMEGEAIVDDPAYRFRILSQLQACHGGGAPEDYQTMYEASMVRDEGMAKTLAAAFNRVRADRASSQGPVVSYTGGGHVQYRLPVPNRVARRVQGGLKQVTVYMATFERERAAEIYQTMQEGIADFVWLSPQGSQGTPRRCR